MMAAPTRNPIPELLALFQRGDAEAARLDVLLAGGHPEPHIAAHHTCWNGGPCVACAAHEQMCAEVDAQERAMERRR